jgi:O-methyltransferase
MTQAIDNAAITLLRLANGYQISQAIHVAAELNVADIIGDEPVSVEDIAPRVAAHPGSLYRKMAGWTYLADKPEETAAVNAGQAALSRNVAPAITAAYDFARFRRIVDVGGGNGTLLAAILSATPRPTGIVFDLPHVIPSAVAVIRRAGLEGRCETAGGSYLDAVPQGGTRISSSPSSWTKPTSGRPWSSATSGRRWGHAAPSS